MKTVMIVQKMVHLIVKMMIVMTVTISMKALFLKAPFMVMYRAQKL
jgi:hypothetical protein